MQIEAESGHTSVVTRLHFKNQAYVRNTAALPDMTLIFCEKAWIRSACSALQGPAGRRSNVLGLCPRTVHVPSETRPTGPQSSGTMEQQPGSTQTTYMKVRSNANHPRLFQTQQTTEIVHGDLDAISADLRSLITGCPNCARLAGAADIK
jgi:hypothetical protein